MTGDYQKLDSIVQNLGYLKGQAEKWGFPEVALFIGAARLVGLDVAANIKAFESTRKARSSEKNIT